MKVTFERSVFASTLSFVRNAIPKKEVEPVLSNFLLRTLDDGSGRVEIVATDMDLMSVAYVKATVEEPGVITIPGSKLLSLVAKLTGETITIATEGTSVKISCGRYNGEFKTISHEDYPKVYEITQTERLVSLPRESLLLGFKRIDFAVNEDEARKQLMAVQLSKKGMVATNGKVTAIFKEPFNVEELCISSNCLKDLTAVLAASPVETVDIFEEEAYLVFKFADNIFFTRKTQVNFPEVFNKIDAPTEKSNTQILKFNVKELKSVLQRVLLTAAEDTRLVVFTLLTDDRMKISARDNRDFYSEEDLAVSISGIPLPEGDAKYEVGFNYDFLLEILSKMAGEDIEFRLADNLRIPVRIEEGKTVYLLMRSVI